MTQSYEQLVAAFVEMMEVGEADQWKLAEIAYLAISAGKTGAEFGADTGYAKGTINKYVAAYRYNQANQAVVSDDHLTFADVVTLAAMSEDRAAAVQILAGATGTPIGTVKSDTEAINVVRDFLVDNPDLMKDALKDDAARSAVASAAFKAASEDVVAEASGITKEAAEKKTPKKNTTSRAVEVERVKYKASMAGRWAKGNMPELMRDVEALAPYMTEDELMFVWEQLGTAFDLIAEARASVKACIQAKASV